MLSGSTERTRGLITFAPRASAEESYSLGSCFQLFDLVRTYWCTYNRRIIALRLCLLCFLSEQGADMGIDSAVEQGEIPRTADGDPLSSARDDSGEHRIGITQITDIVCIELENIICLSGILKETSW